jgi:hypothetical protein
LTRKTFLFRIALIALISACSSQKEIIVQYIGQRYSKTQNKSFVNNELLLLKGKDTIHMNVKLPYDPATGDTINGGILYRCFLKADKLYTIKLKCIYAADIPDAVNSYYKINILQPGKRSSFREIKKDTEYLRRNPGKYVDINNRVYELLQLSPDTDCAFE